MRTSVYLISGQFGDTTSVVGADPGGTKTNKAQELDIEMIDEAALRKLAGV